MKRKFEILKDWSDNKANSGVIRQTNKKCVWNGQATKEQLFFSFKFEIKHFKRR